MALIPELLSNIILLVTGPFALLKLPCVFIIRTAFLFIYTWTELVKATFRFHLNLILRIISWAIGIVSIPSRIVSALRRERQLEQQLQDLQNELENIVGDQKVLQEHLKMAIRERQERKRMEAVLSDLEEEHDMAIAKIEQLEAKLQDLNDENRRLKEIQGKARWSWKDQNDTDNGQIIGGNDFGSSHSILSGNSNYNGSEIAFQSLIMHKDIWEHESKNTTELLKLLKTGSKSGTALPVGLETMSKEVERSDVLDHRRDAALSQSLFSAFLSLLVGVIVWEADDPCMPLVVALFTVVGMSLKSVVQFFSTIKNKPASDAVALLSFNWFVLGTLTYPTLPRVARLLAPTLSSLLRQTMIKIGLLYF
ncbi:uncharacterized protein LOC129321701 isoform X2 [Prosopis cineraria]|uniref:uncharacterized protein LOC129321701 isoform X2 n=1 Tax=Prosopis cineraria TaxID=364024 RepID=UPI0024107A39|nr:uncharacterized protein LOC129321701 isoform X2 [Prosopis cineraria]